MEYFNARLPSLDFARDKIFYPISSLYKGRFNFSHLVVSLSFDFAQDSYQNPEFIEGSNHPHVMRILLYIETGRQAFQGTGLW